MTITKEGLIEKIYNAKESQHFARKDLSLDALTKSYAIERYNGRISAFAELLNALGVSEAEEDEIFARINKRLQAREPIA